MIIIRDEKRKKWHWRKTSRTDGRKDVKDKKAPILDWTLWWIQWRKYYDFIELNAFAQNSQVRYQQPKTVLGLFKPTFVFPPLHVCKYMYIYLVISAIHLPIFQFHPCDVQRFPPSTRQTVAETNTRGAPRVTWLSFFFLSWLSNLHVRGWVNL